VFRNCFFFGVLWLRPNCGLGSVPVGITQSFSGSLLGSGYVFVFFFVTPSLSYDFFFSFSDSFSPPNKQAGWLLFSRRRLIALSYFSVSFNEIFVLPLLA